MSCSVCSALCTFRRTCAAARKSHMRFGIRHMRPQPTTNRPSCTRRGDGDRAQHARGARVGIWRRKKSVPSNRASQISEALAAPCRTQQFGTWVRGRRCGSAERMCPPSSTTVRSPSSGQPTRSACHVLICQPRTQSTRRQSTRSSSCLACEGGFHPCEMVSASPPPSDTLPCAFCRCRRKVVHNITSYPVTERPGTESYDPVLLGGKSVRCPPERVCPVAISRALLSPRAASWVSRSRVRRKRISSAHT